MKHIISTPAIWLLALLIMVACSGEKSRQETSAKVNEAEVLLQYLEQNGDIVNHPDIPYFISAEEIHNNRNGSNYLVIDIRSARDYNRGHIALAVNVEPLHMLQYFEERIEPNSFTKIALVCNNGQHSGYVTAILRMLGYNNVYNMRFGMSAWHENIARRYWSAHISDDLLGKLEVTPHPKNAPSQLPVINTGYTDGYDILRSRAQAALEITWKNIVVDYMDILEQTENYYVINYWPISLYDQGHLPGAIQYTPKKAFRSDEEILTLPTDRPLVVYCFNNHHASWANAFLAILGYDIRSMEYGANAFIYQTMQLTQPTGRTFSDLHIKNYPLVTDGLENMSTERAVAAEKVEVSTAQGGC